MIIAQVILKGLASFISICAIDNSVYGEWKFSSWLVLLILLFAIWWR